MQTEISHALSTLERSVANLGALERAWRPGISPAQIESLESQLHPYLLPAEVVDLYAWHDGAGEPLALIPGYRYLSLSEAIQQYRFQFELCGGTEGWNPVWFPLFSLQGDLYCVILSTQRQRTSPVYLSFNQDTEIYLTFPNLAALVCASAECFARGIYSIGDGYLENDKEAEKEVASRFGSPFPERITDGVTSFSKFSTLKWPESWRVAIGRRDEDYFVQGADETVTGFLKAPRPVRIQAQIVELLGSSDGTVLGVHDSSGSMTVYCPRSAIGAREIQIGRGYEFSIGPMEIDLPAFVAESGVECSALVTHAVRLK